MNDDELEQLRRDVRYLKDRSEILDCIARHARGNDRHDETITSRRNPAVARGFKMVAVFMSTSPFECLWS